MKPNLAVSNTGEKTDSELKNHVLAELKYEPSVKATDIGVLVNDGTVTLNGFVPSYWEKWGAVAATKRVAGIKAIADDIEVRLPSSSHQTDGDIAAAAANQIEWATTIPEDAVKITVREGVVTIDGTVEWRFQKESAERVVRSLVGVKAVSNLIAIEAKTQVSEISAAIKSAFERNAQLDSKKIDIAVSGNEAVLSGEVRTHAERDEAERVAWRAPGIYSVDNQLTVKSTWFGG